MKNCCSKFLIVLLPFFFLPGWSSGFDRDSLYNLIHKENTWKKDTNTVKQYISIATAYYKILLKPDSARYWADKSIELASALNFKTGLGNGYYIKAISYINEDDYEALTENLMKAVEAYNSDYTTENITGIAKVYMQQAIADYRLHHLKEALNAIEEAIKIMRKFRLEPFTTLIYLKGVFLLEDGYVAQALPILEEALALRIREKNEQGIMECRIYTAVAHGKLGDFDKATGLFNKAYAWAVKKEDSEAISVIKSKEGECYFDYKKYKEAEEAILLALKHTEQTDRTLHSLQLLAKVYAATGRYEEAYERLSQHIASNNFENVEILTRQMASLRTRSDIAKKESEIALLEQKNRNDRLLNSGLIIVSILILITSIISYKRFTFKRDANRKLSQANQELMQTLEDLQLAEQQLLQAEKMASLGRVTAGIAHELRNPLNFIHNFAAVASETVEEFLDADDSNKQVLADDLKTSIDKIKLHGNKAEQIITTMLRHGKDKVLDLENVSLHELIDESIAIATKNFSFKHEGFQCKVDLEEQRPEVRIRVNPKSIPLVLGNLIDNAMYSVMQKSRHLSNGYLPEIRVTQEMNERGLVLEIVDNGLGLQKKNANEIFEPFYTTKPTGHGTGLGLSICYEILKAHGASINVKDNEHGGATFSILFPNTLIIN